MSDNAITYVYKLTSASAWAAAVAAGNFAGSADDLRDGYIHLSSASQLAETARRHFRGAHDHVVAAFAARDLGERLKWEPSRGGALFPHLYAPLPTHLALWVRPAPLDADGVPSIPEGVR